MKNIFSVYVPGSVVTDAANSLYKALKGLDPGTSYAEMMRLRASGNAAKECTDVYYLCTDERGELVSRLWMGWGKHERAVGNWGNFLTSPQYRGQGIGRQMLNLWHNDLKTRQDLPIALFCTAGDEGLARLYAPYGFRPALKDTSCGPLYCPIGNSPKTFAEFCEQYYTPARSLVFKPATLEYRHEIDCLFKFAMLDANLDYLPSGIDSLEAALLCDDRNRTEIIFTDTNIPVGIAHTKSDGKKDIRIHPNYVHLI